mgnify:CR=1 FL=1
MTQYDNLFQIFFQNYNGIWFRLHSYMIYTKHGT